MSDKSLVLVIEDDTDIRNLIRINLRAAGFSVLTAETGEEGLELALEHQPHVITLDRMLPGISGAEVCARLRADTATADLYIMMVTALGENSDRIEGFEVGADDYVPKPFQVEELILRVTAAARRMHRLREVGSLPAAAAPADDTVIELPRLRVDDNQHRIWIDEDEVEMTITEYRLLLHLVNKRGNLCTRGELLQEVWELPPNLNTRTVDTHVKRLRQKLGPLTDYIQTVRGAGYRFVVP